MPRMNAGFQPDVAFLLRSECGSDDHSGGYRFVGAWVDEDERTRGPIAPIGVVNQRGGGAQRDAADVIHRETVDPFNLVERVDIHVVLDVLDDRFGFLGRVAEY